MFAEPYFRESKHLYVAFTASTSLQQQLDVLCVVHRETVAAGQGMEQRCFSFRGKFSKWMNEGISTKVLEWREQDKLTVFVSCVYISTQIQQHEQTGESFWLFTGQIQRTALMDLPSKGYLFISKTDTVKGDDRSKKGETAPSPCPSSQCLLHGWQAASACPACFSAPRCAEDCSTILDLEDRANVYSEKWFQSLLSSRFHTWRGTGHDMEEKRSFSATRILHLSQE